MQIKLYRKKLLANKILHCTFCTYETSKKIRTYQILDSQRCYYIGDKLMNSKSLFVVGRAKKRSIYMNDLRGKFQKSRKILMPSMHAAAVLGIFLSFSAGDRKSVV